MKTEDLQKLKALALAATPNWYRDKYGQLMTGPDEPLYMRGATIAAAGRRVEQAEKNTDFIGAVTPSTILELIALAERAIAEPAASVDTPEFQVKLAVWTGHLDYFQDCAHDTVKQSRAALIDHLNAWGSAQREAGQKAAVLEYMPKVGVLMNRVQELEAQLAARPAVDFLLRSRVADMLHLLEHLPFTSDGDLDQARKAMADVREMLSQPPASAPTVPLPSCWQVVPVLPTLEMEVAFAEVWFARKRPIDDPDMADAYAAMIAAAPSYGGVAANPDIE